MLKTFLSALLGIGIALVVLWSLPLAAYPEQASVVEGNTLATFYQQSIQINEYPQVFTQTLVRITPAGNPRWGQDYLITDGYASIRPPALYFEQNPIPNAWVALAYTTTTIAESNIFRYVEHSFYLIAPEASFAQRPLLWSQIERKVSFRDPRVPNLDPELLAYLKTSEKFDFESVFQTRNITDSLEPTLLEGVIPYTYPEDGNAIAAMLELQKQWPETHPGEVLWIHTIIADPPNMDQSSGFEVYLFPANRNIAFDCPEGISPLQIGTQCSTLSDTFTIGEPLSQAQVNNLEMVTEEQLRLDGQFRALYYAEDMSEAEQNAPIEIPKLEIPEMIGFVCSFDSKECHQLGNVYPILEPIKGGDGGKHTCGVFRRFWGRCF